MSQLGHTRSLRTASTRLGSRACASRCSSRLRSRNPPCSSPNDAHACKGSCLRSSSSPSPSRYSCHYSCHCCHCCSRYCSRCCCWPALFGKGLFPWRVPAKHTCHRRRRTRPALWHPMTRNRMPTVPAAAAARPLPAVRAERKVRMPRPAARAGPHVERAAAARCDRRRRAAMPLLLPPPTPAAATRGPRRREGGSAQPHA